MGISPSRREVAKSKLGDKEKAAWQRGTEKQGREIGQGSMAATGDGEDSSAGYHACVNAAGAGAPRARASAVVRSDLLI